MSSIPEEVYFEILVRAPAKSTFVCRTWYALISDPDFVKSHLNLTIQKNKSSLMLTSEEVIYTIGHESIELLSSSVQFKEYASEIEFPLKGSLGMMLIFILGSCNGLVCLGLSNYECDTGFYCLWNPASTEYKEFVKPPDLVQDLDDFTVSAFGYDCETDDYKFVVGEDSEENEYGSVVQVYTLSSDSWNSSRTVPYSFYGDQGAGGVLVNGDLHWLALLQDDSEVVASLDISKEMFRELQLPKEALKNKHLFKSVGVLEGCLCVLVDAMKVHFEVWVMKEYGVQESWTKHCIITYDRIMQAMSVWFICSFKNGEILFGVSDSSLLLYDPKNGSVMKPNIHRSIELSHAAFYLESLVSLNSHTYV